MDLHSADPRASSDAAQRIVILGISLGVALAALALTGPWLGIPMAVLGTVAACAWPISS
ncbi:hypothetical protein [Nodularia spumigena]|jgi:hypothetical protein|uniref:hypothetical protein n=1 Tax=Nodularia spumigena TaxID=70799 RepID=UPI002B1F2016|nr:hypothetical protein [Nodularia spumigena]MEA5612388.1 hypothetical protein [Nodularia spumigena UHCC 0040]